MKNLLLVLCCTSLVGCANAFSSADTQCERNPTVDGLAITALTGVPIIVASTTPIGISIAAIVGGSYYVTHKVVCP